MTEPGEEIFDQAGEIQQAAIVLERRKIALIGDTQGSGRITPDSPGQRSFLTGFDLDFDELVAAIKIMGSSFWDTVMPGAESGIGGDYEDEMHAKIEAAGSHWVEGMLVGMLIEQRRRSGEAPTIERALKNIDLVKESMNRHYMKERKDDDR